MDPIQTQQGSPGEQIFATGEISLKGFAFGGTMRLIRNAYVDNMHLVESFIDPPIVENNYKPQFDYFISLGAEKGHSFGATGSYTNSEGPKTFQGTQQQAKTNGYSIGVSYSYLF
jgi:hypothetical protein